METSGEQGTAVDRKEMAKERVVDTKERAAGAVRGARERVAARVAGARERVAESAGGAKDAVRARVGEKRPDPEQAKQRAREVAERARGNPVALVVGSVGTGFLVGLLVPSTRLEEERVRPVAEQWKERVKDRGQELIERGKQVARETGQVAARDVPQQTVQAVSEAVRQGESPVEAVKRTARDQSQQLAATAKQKAKDQTAR